MTWGQGENFYTVAAMYNTDWMALWSLNGGDAPDVAQVRGRRRHMVLGEGWKEGICTMRMGACLMAETSEMPIVLMREGGYNVSEGGTDVGERTGGHAIQIRA